jgi:hypothetical protein
MNYGELEGESPETVTRRCKRWIAFQGAQARQRRRDRGGPGFGRRVFPQQRRRRNLEQPPGFRRDPGNPDRPRPREGGYPGGYEGPPGRASYSIPGIPWVTTSTPGRRRPFPWAGMPSCKAWPFPGARSRHPGASAEVSSGRARSFTRTRACTSVASAAGIWGWARPVPPSLPRNPAGPGRHPSRNAATGPSVPITMHYGDMNRTLPHLLLFLTDLAIRPPQSHDRDRHPMFGTGFFRFISNDQVSFPFFGFILASG